MKYEIVTYGAPILRKPAIPVANVTKDIRQLVDDLLETMYAYKGVGLAAEQIGRLSSVCVIDIPRPDGPEAPESALSDAPVAMPLIMFNPRIIEKSGDVTTEEGCLSFPGIYAPVRRFCEVTVSYLDPKGKPCVLRARNLLARAVQHECDHLSAVLLVDRMSAVKRISLSGSLKRLKKEGASKFSTSG
jgi:peptide deformylase